MTGTSTMTFDGIIVTNSVVDSQNIVLGPPREATHLAIEYAWQKTHDASDRLRFQNAAMAMSRQAMSQVNATLAMLRNTDWSTATMEQKWNLSQSLLKAGVSVPESEKTGYRVILDGAPVYVPVIGDMPGEFYPTGFQPDNGKLVYSGIPYIPPFYYQDPSGNRYLALSTDDYERKVGTAYKPGEFLNPMQSPYSFDIAPSAAVPGDYFRSTTGQLYIVNSATNSFGRYTTTEVSELPDSTATGKAPEDALPGSYFKSVLDNKYYLVTYNRDSNGDPVALEVTSPSARNITFDRLISREQIEDWTTQLRNINDDLSQYSFTQSSMVQELSNEMQRMSSLLTNLMQRLERAVSSVLDRT